MKLTQLHVYLAVSDMAEPIAMGLHSSVHKHYIQICCKMQLHLRPIHLWYNIHVEGLFSSHSNVYHSARMVSHANMQSS